MGNTYEILLEKGETPDKRKIEIREAATGRTISCEVDAKKVKHMKGSEPVYSKETDNILEFTMALRHFDLDSCADKVDEWIREAGDKGEDG